MEEKRRDNETLPPSAASAGKGIVSPATEPAPIRRRGGAHKRKSNAVSASHSSSSAPSSKRFTREKAMLMSQPPLHNGPLTRARQAPTNYTLGSAAVLPPGSSSDRGMMSEGNKTTAGSKESTRLEEEMMIKASAEWEALEAKIQAEFEAIRSRDSNGHVVPNHCGWFSWTEVHSLEERSLPSFFNGKSQTRTPELYMEIRNWIMKKFHANPNTHIELKDMSELEVADVEAKHEVLEFLDYWGLINFHPFPPKDSTTTDVDGAKKADAKESLIEKLYRFEAIPSYPHFVSKSHLMAPSTPSRMLSQSAIAEELVKEEGPAVEYHCNSCSADCSRKRYHCQKQADFDLCSECFTSSKFGSNMSSSDFILMEPAEIPGASSGKWTDQETLLLLEALELYKENWNEIAEHVATKTKAQCILHFLQMPIEDCFLDFNEEEDSILKDIPETLSVTNDDTTTVKKDVPESTQVTNGASADANPPTSPIETSDPADSSEVKVPQGASEAEDVNEDNNDQEKKSKSNNTEENKGEEEIHENFALKALNEAFKDVGYPLTSEGSLSFNDAGNPIMALMAFLVRLVDSDVATASAHTSLKSASSDSPGLQLASKHCFLLEDPPVDKKELAASDGAAADMNTQETRNDENAEDKSQNNNSVSVLDETDASNDHDSKENNVSKETHISAGDEITAKIIKEVELSNTNDATAAQPTIANKPTEMASKAPLDSVKEDGGENLAEGPFQPTESEKFAKASSDYTPGEKIEPSQLGKSDSAGDASQHIEASTDVEMTDSLPSEKNKVEVDVSELEKKTMSAAALSSDTLTTKQPVASNPAVENGEVTGNGEDIDYKKEKQVCQGMKDDPILEKLKRSAVSTISAAAVKAKFLAGEEEDQIRQLAISLIEKQLHKLDTKLLFFNEMDSLMMRVREQLDKSRQKLYHERAQIIAARLGLPASSSKPAAPPSVPSNRIAANFANLVPRPPMMGMSSSSRPPVQKMMGPTAPPTSTPLASTMTANSSAQPSGTN